ncbi:MAG: transcription termination/antitermination protein NusG [Thermodesulfovibrionales bacterium]
MLAWYALYTKPGAEDLVSRQLNAAGIETLAPKIMVTKYLRKKYIQVQEYFFPCYVLACFDSQTHSHMLRYTRGVRYIVGKERPLAVPPEIIGALLTRMSGDMIRPEEEALEKGERVLIKDGPFKDLYGLFERQIPGRERVMILIEAIHGRLELDRRSVKKA